MTFADKISRDTAAHDPAIAREEGGDLVFFWPIKNARRAHHQRWQIAAAIGIQSDMIRIDRFRNRLLLCVPAEIAARVAS